MTNNEQVHYGPALFTGASDIAGFINVYKEAFGGPPYNETYTDEEVRAIWDEHFAHGRIILAKHGGKVVGLGCSVPLNRAPQEIQDFLAMCKRKGYLDMCKRKGYLPVDFTFENAWYMSELAVLEEYRNQGIAYQLVRHRLIDVSHGRSAFYVMRTAAAKSNSMHLYLRAGAEVIPEVHDISDSDQVKENGSKSEERIYLFGSSALALNFLALRLGDQEEGDSDEPEQKSSPNGDNSQEDAA